MPATAPIADRLWSKVNKTDTCWLWTGSTKWNGYGAIGAGPGTRYNLSTHRLSWELHFGSIPDGICVLHKCDVRNCVNPEHLFLGTYADNNHDMRLKGRNRGGGPLGHKGAIQTPEFLARQRILFSCHFHITAPDGSVIHGVGLTKFAKDKHLSISCLYRLRDGLISEWRGFTDLIIDKPSPIKGRGHY